MVQAYRHIVRASPVRTAPIDGLSAPFRQLAGGTEYILSRRFCSFRSKSIEGRKPTRDLIRAAILEATTASSCSDARAFVTLTGSVLGIWTWDNADLADVLAPSARRQAVPETLYHRPVDGFALRLCIDGVEGQWWQSGALLASRWWPEPPPASEWALFKRAVGGAAIDDTFIPPGLTQGFDATLSRPRNLAPLADRLKLVSPPEIALVLAAIVSIPAIYLTTSAASLGVEAMSLSNQKLRLEEATAGRAELSREMVGMRRQLVAFQGLFRTNDPLSSLEAAVQEVVSRDGEVIRLSFEDGKVSVQFETAGALSERDLVTALEASPALRDVSVRKQGDSRIWTIDASAIPAGGGEP